MTLDVRKIYDICKRQDVAFEVPSSLFVYHCGKLVEDVECKCELLSVYLLVAQKQAESLRKIKTVK